MIAPRPVRNVQLVDSELQHAFTRAAAGHMFARYDGVLAVDGGVGDKHA